MTGSLGWLFAAVLFFIGIHIVPSSVLRGAITSKIGERAYTGLFSLFSALGLAWAIWAYSDMPPPETYYWDAGAVGRHIALVLMAIAFILLVCALTIRNPTGVGGESVLRQKDAAYGIIRVTRHPLMWGFGLWGIAHILNNSDPASLVLFGGMTVLALVGTVLMDAKKRAKLGEDWARFEAQTSNLPFAAIAAGRNRLALGEIGWWRLAVGLLLYLVVLRYHTTLFGAYPLP